MQNSPWSKNGKAIQVLVKDIAVDMESKPSNPNLSSYIKEASGSLEYALQMVQPSKVSQDIDAVRLAAPIEIHDRVELFGKDYEDHILGNVIHQSLAVFRMNNQSSNERKVERIISLNEMQGVVKHEELLEKMQLFCDYMEKKFKPQRICRELPVKVKKGEQWYTGIIDLFLEVDDDNLIVIDYKSYQGTDNDKIKKFGAQVLTYRDMLAKIYPEKNIKTMVYLVMQGKLIEVSK
jgi:ATP-dependent exoDNAse (exonuclease V) beta subunit